MSMQQIVDDTRSLMGEIVGQREVRAAEQRARLAELEQRRQEIAGALERLHASRSAMHDELTRFLSKDAGQRRKEVQGFLKTLERESRQRAKEIGALLEEVAGAQQAMAEEWRKLAGLPARRSSGGTRPSSRSRPKTKSATRASREPSHE